MTVSWAARKLLERYDGSTRVSRRWESTVVDLVVRYGSRADVEALLPVFLDDPEAREELVPVFARHGDVTVAERLLEATLEGGRLREDVPSEVLRAVGYLGCEAAERTLWEHVQDPYSHYVSMDACLGLLHLPCRDLGDEIAQALERHVDSALFPEFLPVLATKTGDPSWLPRLVAWGENRASTDCNGGLILGVALHGDVAEFTRLLWNPAWEAQGGGTGSDAWAYAGARVLGLGLPRLYADLVARLESDADADTKRHCLATFAALLGPWGNWAWFVPRTAPEPEESSDAVYDLLFEWSTPHADDSLTGLARRVLDRDDPLHHHLHDLRRAWESELHHEWELRAVAAGG